MELLFYFFVFLFGTAIGSFLNVVIDSSNEGKLFENRRSHCDHCHHKLSIGDLVPVVSFLVLGGKCRYCHKAISWYYPIVELVTGLSFLLVAWTVFGHDVSSTLGSIRYLFAGVYFSYIIASLTVIFFADLKYGIIPFPAVFSSVLFTFLWYFSVPVLHFQPGDLPLILFTHSYLFNYLFSALGSFFFFFLLFVLTKGRGMGFGDVIYAFLMGFLLGYPKIILSFYLAFIVGAIVSLLLVVLQKKKLKGSTIPFGPFLVMGTVVSLFWGNVLIEKILMLLVR
jgi:leader peptidase (prepilin peptidase)/N-methyltransferase